MEPRLYLGFNRQPVPLEERTRWCATWCISN